MKNIMEILRALELDGLIEAVKPAEGVRVPKHFRNGGQGDEDDEDGDGRSRKKRKLDTVRWESLTDKEQAKIKDKAKARKQKEIRKEEKRKAKKKEERKKRKKSKGKSKGKKSRKRHNPLLSEESDDEANDSDSLVGLDEVRNLSDLDKSDKKKKKKKRRRSETPSSDSSASSSASDSSSDDSDSDSDSDSDISSVATEDIDLDIFLPRETSSSSRPAQQVEIDASPPDDLAVVYRATKRLHLPLGQVQAPCGQCPVFAFCDEAGPVNPVGCKYFGDWLGDIVGGWDRVGLDMFRGDREEDEGLEGGEMQGLERMDEPGLEEGKEVDMEDLGPSVSER